MKNMERGIWKDMKSNHGIRGLTVIITGIVVTVFLWWFLGGFGFWTLPGLTILMVGIAEVLYILYTISMNRKSALLHVGFPLLFLGIGFYMSFAGHVILGTLQILSLALLVVGMLLSAIGAFSSRKA
jgi:hypothetical protein